MTISQETTRNLLLSSLSATDWALLKPFLTRIVLPRSQVFYTVDSDIDEIYFPEDGIISAVATEASGRQVEVGIVGREGMVGTPLVLGIRKSPYHVYVHVAGVSALKLDAVQLSEAMQASPTLTAYLLRYAHTVQVQVSTSVSALASYKIEQRLARWLLMCDDRLVGNIRLTHESISIMLGTRRAGVTLATQALKERRLIKARRGSIFISNRPGLESASGGCYGFAEREFQRVMGMPIQTKPRHGSTNAIMAMS